MEKRTESKLKMSTPPKSREEFNTLTVNDAANKLASKYSLTGEYRIQAADLRATASDFCRIFPS